MPLLYSFCTWFSVRLGTIIVAVVSLIQAVALLVIIVMNIWNHEIISQRLGQFGNENDLMFAGQYVLYLQESVRKVLVAVAAFLVIYVITCLLLLHGSYCLEKWSIVPYVAIEFIRLLILTFLATVAMILIKKNVLDFNILIVCLVSSGFILLLLYYFWLCPVSLLQCIHVINEQRKVLAHESVISKPIPDLTPLYAYLTDPLKPVMPARNYHQYQYQYGYGTLPDLYF